MNITNVASAKASGESESDSDAEYHWHGHENKKARINFCFYYLWFSVQLPLSVSSGSFAGFPLDLFLFVLEEPSAPALLKDSGLEDLSPEAADDPVFGLLVAHCDLHVVITRFAVKGGGWIIGECCSRVRDAWKWNWNWTKRNVTSSDSGRGKAKQWGEGEFVWRCRSRRGTRNGHYCRLSCRVPRYNRVSVVFLFFGQKGQCR